MTTGQDPAKKQPDENLSLAEILNIVNEPFKEFLTSHDKVVRSIVDDIQEDVEIIEAFRAGNNADILAKLIYEKLMEKAAGNIEKFMDLLNELSDNTPFSKAFVSAMVDLMAKNTANDQALPFDTDKLIASIVADQEGEFVELQRWMRPLPEVVETMLRLVVKETMPKYDGMNDLIKDSLNHLYCTDEMRMVDRRRHFNTLLNKYEAFLKKLFYILKGYEMRPVLPDHVAPSFMDALLSYRCLSGLRNNPAPTYQKFANYLELVKNWRNDESHEAATSTEQELKAATHILMAMYVFVVSQSTAELDEVGALE